MLNLSELRDKFHFIVSIEYFDFRAGSSFQYSKYLLLLKNQTKLFVTEFVTLNERSYSYHLQDVKDDLIQRWDNSKHHPEILTYPHHTHLGDDILLSEEITIEDVLTLLSKRFD